MNPHRSRVFKSTERRSPDGRLFDRRRPWKHFCTCGSFSEWKFWPNALRRAEHHRRYPGVYS